MEDKTTPHLTLEGHEALLSGSGFLAGREAHLRARLAELEAELADGGDVPDGVEGLEQQAFDALRSLMNLLEPPTPAAAPPPQQQEMQADASATMTGSRKRIWRPIVLLAAALVVALSAVAFAWLHGRTDLADDAPATAAARVASTRQPVLPTLTLASPMRPPATSTAVPFPTAAAPVLPDVPRRIGESAQAATLQTVDISGTLRLELPLAVMSETIQLVEGSPVLKATLPASGAGVHRGSAPFGESGTTLVALSAATAPAGLWQTRPGDRLVGCNTDGTCQDYQITTAETWPRDHVRRLLSEWPAEGGLLIYTAQDEADAWVLQAEPQRRETTR